MKKNIFFLLLSALFFVACDDLFEPGIENQRELDAMYNESGYAQGILANGYTRIPTNSFSFNDVATDDAVSNDMTNAYLTMAIGQWSSSNNPTERWRNCLFAIQYMNIFLNETDKVDWAQDEAVKKMFNDRMRGEAYGLRALFMYYLLQAHGGWASNGELLGFPILLDPLDFESDFNLPRATFEECVQQIFSDIKAAEDLLPLDYEELANNSQVPAKYSGVEYTKYNRVFGEQFRGRISSRIIKAIRAQVALLAASPAYAEGTSMTWEEVARYAAEVLELNGGISAIDPKGWTWFSNNAEIEALKEGANPAEILWRGGIASSSSLEADHFPPTLYGNGRINPTQNLVDAFPMANGYPISSVSSGYDASKPYADRDPRLAAYIVYNGSTVGVSNSTIWIQEQGDNNTTNDAVNRMEKSTRTGYYMRKHLRQDVNLNPSGVNAQNHYTPRIRYTELFLIYAEAVNEAYGPDGKAPGVSYSARDVIKALRERAGVGTSNGDPYLTSITSTSDMRQLIRNERRLELCFEGHRFWDIRRWKENLTEPARGITISSTGVITGSTVEIRSYKDYMYYGPIPYEETMKWSNLLQNQGWQ